MLQFLKSLSASLYFSAEIGMLLALAYTGWQISRSVMGKYALAIGLPVLALVVWGILIAPRSAYRLALPHRTLVAMLLFGVATFLLYHTGHDRLALGFGGLALLSQVLLLALEQS
jgi:hypothetical protein